MFASVLCRLLKVYTDWQSHPAQCSSTLGSVHQWGWDASVEGSRHLTGKKKMEVHT